VGKSPFPPMVHAIRQILDRILKEALKKYKEKYVTDLKDKLKQKVKEKVLDKVKLKLQNSGISESQLEDTAKSLKDKFKKFF
jgi:glutamyl-tRNA reductase